MKDKYYPSVKFGNWLLKYAVPEYDTEFVLCWKYENKYYGSKELFKIFLKTISEE